MSVASLSGGGMSGRQQQTLLIEAPKVRTPFGDARPVLNLMRAHPPLREQLPRELAGTPPADLEAAWPGWVAQRDADIRDRLARGDEDSLVNLWLYGTTFTDLPPARSRELARLDRRLSTAQILEERLDDLVAGIASPGSNERLRFARRVVERRGIDPAAADGPGQVRRFLVETRERVLAEYAATDRVVAAARESAKRNNDPTYEIAAFSAIFRDRGFASDTSLLPGFGVEQVLRALAAERVLDAGRVRRVAIVGPGLDFINKADGYDFYPPQTIQPFALIDSLLRLGLATAGDLRVTTFDLNPRVNEHLEAAVQRAAGGEGYVLQLPLSEQEPWNPALVAYWRRFGDRVGKEVEALPVPETVAGVATRAVRVRPEIVRSIHSRDLNIVLERIELPDADERFDLIVGTNILVYYGPFEQSLALANAASMLRPGGVILVNSGAVPAAPLDPSVGYVPLVYSDRQQEHMFWYRRR